MTAPILITGATDSIGSARGQGLNALTRASAIGSYGQ
jgi:hypothetical protein